MGRKPITYKKTFNTMGLKPITYKNIQHNGTEAYHLQKTFNTMGLKPITYKKHSTQWD